MAEQRERNVEAGQFTELVRDFLDPKDFYNDLAAHGMDYFCGVPDSLLKDFCAYVTTVTPKSHHVITANEGQAIALAAGYHMATGKTGVVYLQVRMDLVLLTLSLLRVINVKFLLQPHQKYYITQ